MTQRMWRDYDWLTVEWRPWRWRWGRVRFAGGGWCDIRGPFEFHHGCGRQG